MLFRSYDTRELAIRRLHKSYVTAFSLLLAQKIKKFQVKFQKKKDNIKSFEVNKNAIKITAEGEIRIFPTRLKNNIRLRKRDRTKLIKLETKKANTNTVIIKEYNKWYICLQFPASKNNNKEKPIFSSVFLDPGVRKFQNFYSPDGICGHLGDRYCKKNITPIKKEISKYRSIIETEKKKNLKKRCWKLITKVKNIVGDLHNQTANFLTTTFEAIFIPIFETKKMANKATRKIDKGTTSEMLSLSHYKFREKLKNMCKIRGNKFKVITEENTSKTCTNCGTINKDLGKLEIFKCKKCKLEIDRDINASRNICIKNIKTEV